MEALHPKKAKIPLIDPFDGTTNLDDHLDIYKSEMYVQNVKDATCYHHVSITLKGIAQRCFNGLPNGSITSFL